MTSPDPRPAAPEASRPTARTRSSPYPRYSLKAVEELAKTVVAMGARHCDQEQVAKELGYSGAKNGAFKGIRAAASYFGVITYSDDVFLSVTEPWIKAFMDQDEEQLRQLRADAVQRPELYKTLIEEYDTKQLPSLERLALRLHLTPKYGILKDAADTAARVFWDSAEHAGMISPNGFLQVTANGGSGSAAAADDQPSLPLDGPSGSDSSKDSRVPPAKASSRGIEPPAEDGLDQLCVQLANGKRAYLYVPVPLSAKEKTRLKSYIDLILEPDEYDSPPHRQDGDAGASGGSA